MSERRDVVGLGVTSLTSGLWVSAIGLLVPGLAVVLVWMLTPQQAGLGADLPSALRFSAGVWVASHFIPVISSSGVISLFPLLLPVLPGYLLWRAARKAARELEISDTREALLLTLGMAVGHAIFVTLVSALVSSDGMRFRPFQSFGFSLLVAVVFAGVAIFKESGAWEDLRDVLPLWLRAGVLGALVSGLVLVLASGLLLVTAIVVHREDIAAVSNTLGEGVLAQILLLALCLLYLPNMWGWFLSALSGAGTHVGAGAVLALGAGSPSALPPFPLLAALPESMPGWTQALPVCVVIAAVVGVLVSWKRSGSADLYAASTVVVVGAFGVAFVALISGGSLGNGNLADLGPHARNAFALTLAEFSLGAALPVVLHLLKQRRQ